MVVTHAGSATPQANCSSHSTGLPSVGADFCHVSLTVVFEVGVSVKEVTIVLLDDQIAEGDESFYVSLVEGEGLHNGILSDNSQTQVFITDYEDCK